MIEITKAVEGIVLEIANETQIEHSLNLFDSGMLSSIDVLDLILVIESTFAITIPDEEISVDNLGSVARISDFVASVKG